MVMVDVGHSSLQADSQPKSVAWSEGRQPHSSFGKEAGELVIIITRG